jgi:hypothetical protein
LEIVASKRELLLGGPKGLTLCEHMIIDESISDSCSSGIFPPIFHKYRERGLYCLRFFKGTAPVYVVVDSRIPVYADKQPVFAWCKNKSEIWAQLIEKAFAKLVGGYGNLSNMSFADSLQALTGMQSMVLPIHDEAGFFPHRQVR